MAKMHKKLAEFLTQRGFVVTNDTAQGQIKGFDITIGYNAMSNTAPVYGHISFYASENEKYAMAATIKALKIKFLVYQLTTFGLSFGLNDITLGGLLKKLDKNLDDILNVIQNGGGKGAEYCPYCGENLDDYKVCNIDGINIKLHNECVSKLNVEIAEENKEFDAAPNNYLKGTIGLLLGAAIGCVIYIILFMIGFISAISAFAAIALGVFFYKKFGGKPNMTMVILAAVITLASSLLTVYGLHVLAAIGLAFEQTGNAVSGMEAMQLMMQDSEFSASFTSNMVMTIIFTLLGAGYEVFTLSKSVKRTKQIK